MNTVTSLPPLTLASRQSQLPSHNPATGTESTDTFTTSNYGVETTSKAEWAFVADEEATPEQVGFARWPAESEEKLPDRSRCRARPTHLALVEKAKLRNEKLKAVHQPETIIEEILAACMYTGPVSARRGRASLSPSAEASLSPSVHLEH